MSEQAKGLGEELAELEKIVRRLEGEDLDLDAALRLFEDGVGRLRRSREQLQAAELKVQQVLDGADGALRAEPLDG